jgi:hypothetical protein
VQDRRIGQGLSLRVDNAAVLAILPFRQTRDDATPNRLFKPLPWAPPSEAHRHGDAMGELAAQFVALAEHQTTTAPQMVAHRLMGMSFLHTGEIEEGRVRLDRAIALYDPAEHRPLATRFGHDSGMAILCFRSAALWLLGYPEAAHNDADDALKHAREIGQAATLMYALATIPFTHFHSGEYSIISLDAGE